MADANPITTVAHIVDRIRRQVQGSAREPTFPHNGALTDSATTINYTTQPAAIGLGSYVGMGSEIMWVTAQPGASSATVTRGVRGTTAIAHSDGDPMEINHRFFTADMLYALAEEVRSWDGFGVYVPTRSQVTATVAGQGRVDVTTELAGYRELYELRYTTASGKRHKRTTGEVWLSADSVAVRYLQLDQLPPEQWTVDILWGKSLTTDDVGALATTTATIGLDTHNSLVDAAVYGACARLLLTDESPLTQTVMQPQTSRTTGEVRPTEPTQTAGMWLRRRDDALSEYKSWLYEQVGFPDGSPPVF